MSLTSEALLTVDDKTAVGEFGAGLIDLGWRVNAATPGTANALLEVVPHDPEGPTPFQTGYSHLLLQDADFRRAAALNDTESQAGEVASMIINRSRQTGPGPVCGPNLELVCVNLGYSRLGKKDGDMPHLDTGGLALIAAGITANLIVVTDPDDYLFVLDWLSDGKPNEEAAKLSLHRSAAVARLQYEIKYTHQLHLAQPSR